MPTPFESATLNLKLFELRREPVLREARAWFMNEFNPQSFDELVTLASGEHNAKVRMVLGYWDMAASMVTTGAIDAEAFRAAHSEVVATFCKIQPFLPALRSGPGAGNFCKHLQAVVTAIPDIESTLLAMREGFKAMALARQSAAAGMVSRGS